MDSNVEVSIICNTYNHEKYIRDTIEGFLMQKTNFSYEILIHDDASTDRTPEIIREYEMKYPEIIKPIYQTENKYSKGINIMDLYQRPRVSGRYIALCEGDDYWIDKNKLQKQFDALENCAQVDMCAHGAKMLKAKNGKNAGNVTPSKDTTIFNIEAVIRGGGEFFATNTLFFRRALLDNPPEFRKICPYDYALQIAGALRGGVLYLPELMSVYRIAVPGSWTQRIGNSKYYVSQAELLKNMLDMANFETEKKYEQVIIEKKRELTFKELEAKRDYEELKSKEYSDLYIKQPVKWKIKIYIKETFPILYNFHKRVKNLDD